MQAWDIANDALDSVLENVKTALWISIPILVLNIIIIVPLCYSFVQTLLHHGDQAALALLDEPFGIERVITIPLFVAVTSFYWVTVAWHRFVILDERPKGIFPKLYPGCIWAYFWRIILLTVVILIIIALPLGLLSSMLWDIGNVSIANYSGAVQSGLLSVGITFVATVVFSYTFMRYSPFLVAAAIGQPIKAATGRESTYWARKSIFVMAIGYALVPLIKTFVGGGLSTGFWQADLAILLALQWVAFMFTISLLTMLYQNSVANYEDSGREDRIMT